MAGSPRRIFGAHAAHLRRCDLRSSLTHQRMRSLRCSAAPSIWTTWSPNLSPRVPSMTQLPPQDSRVNLSSDPIYRYLRITKGGPGGVPGTSAEQDLVDSAWLQRLRRIHQLQSAWWVFATAEHSRFQHALGAMHLAGEWARHLHPTLVAVCAGTPSVALVEETMRMAGLLHDVGHGPFGHFFDENYLDTWGIDHEVIGRTLITGSLGDLVQGLGASPTADFEPGERVDPRWGAYLLPARRLNR